jgi:hypothetical protein
LVITLSLRGDSVPGGQTLQIVESVLHLFAEFGGVLHGHSALLQRAKVLDTVRETGVNSADEVARNRTSAASLSDLACVGREVVYEVKVMSVLLKVISSSVGEYSCVDDMCLSHAPGIEA